MRDARERGRISDPANAAILPPWRGRVVYGVRVLSQDLDLSCFAGPRAVLRLDSLSVADLRCGIKPSSLN